MISSRTLEGGSSPVEISAIGGEMVGHERLPSDDCVPRVAAITVHFGIDGCVEGSLKLTRSLLNGGRGDVAPDVVAIACGIEVLSSNKRKSLVEKEAETGGEVADGDVAKRFQRQHFEMEGTEEGAVGFIPALYHLNQRNEIAFVVLVGFAHQLNVLFWVRVEPKVTLRVGDDVSTTL